MQKVKFGAALLPFTRSRMYSMTREELSVQNALLPRSTPITRRGAWKTRAMYWLAAAISAATLALII